MIIIIQPETPGTSKMGFFAILLAIMANNSVFDVGRGPELTIGICAPYFLLAYGSEKSQKFEKPQQSPWKACGKGLIIRKN